MKPAAISLFVLSACFANAQENVKSHIENGKFFGIFPLDENLVVYTDTIVYAGSVNKDSLYYKAKTFFEKNDNARYYFESEDKDVGKIIYQGQKSDIHFTIVLQLTDSNCSIKLFEIVVASTKSQYSSTMSGGKVKTGEVDKAVALENIDIDRGDFSRKAFEKMDDRFRSIMEDLSSTLR